MEMMIILFILIIVVLVFVNAGTSKGYNYRKKGPLFTPAERSFLGVLDQALSNDYRIFGKVRVADVLNPAKGMNRKDWQIAFNKISSKHFDYVLCSKDKLEIVAVIELDDKTHNTKKAKARDSLVDNACKTAGLELIRFPAKRAYQVQAVRDKIDGVLTPVAQK